MMFEECFGDGPFIFRLNETGSGPQLLTQVCLERGWREFTPENGDQWNLWWRTSGFSVNHHRNLYAWQYVNHIPKGSSICRKDNLVRYLRCMKRIYGSIYDFSPHGYNLPLEYTKLAAECSKIRPSSSKDDLGSRCVDEKPIWICKPVAQSQGRGIFLFRKLSELSYDTNTIVQRYIEKPLLIGGYKFDLRLYVCIPSYHPLTVYMYREGLARFGTDKFSLNDLRNPFRHLTNSSINKLGPGYAEMKDRVGSGCKWTLRQLRRYFRQARIADWLMWQRIVTLVILTVLSHVNQVPPTVNCFEFFGFDVLIDANLRPWLLEVNLSPALSNDCDADSAVKKPMLHDMFDLLGLPLYNTGLSIFDIWLNDSKENIKDVDNGDNENHKMSKGRHAHVLHAANKWRKKHKKPHSRANSACRTKKRVLSAVDQNSKLLFNVPKQKVTTNENFSQKNIESARNNFQGRWGNGRNWSKAVACEGGWSLLWPMNVEENSENVVRNERDEVKHIVTQVIKFSKICRELARKHPAASECQLNEFLQSDMKMSSDVWMPLI